MRKAIFIFIAIILVAASIDWIHSCAELKSHKEVFGRYLTYADMYEYKDKDYDYVVRVPSFFTAQPDSLQEEKGRIRFEYGDQWITVVIESYVMHNNGQSLKDGMDSLAQVLQATDSRLGSDYFILSGSTMAWTTMPASHTTMPASHGRIPATARCSSAG